MKKNIFIWLSILLIAFIVNCGKEKAERNNPFDPGGVSFKGWTTPTLSGPTSGMSYTLNWTDVGAGSYLIEEASDVTFSNATAYNVTGANRSFSHNENGNTYYYRVKTNKGIKDSGWSNIVTIIIKATGWDIVDIKFATIPGGTFQMGSTYSTDEQPIHTVTVSGFEMSIYEITQGQYQSVMGSNPSYFKSGDNYPVEYVTWYDAVKFCNKLSDEAGLNRCYNETSWACDFSKNGFRLPTEAEWEYACRAGTTTTYNSGNNESDLALAGWYSSNSGSKTHIVGGKTANAFGLYDMHGNVWEWCNDWYGSYSSDNVTNPTGSSTGSYRVIRGGSWLLSAEDCRSASRNRYNPSGTSYYVGFRVVRRP